MTEVDRLKWKMFRLNSKIDSLESKNRRLKKDLQMEKIKSRARTIHIQRKCEQGFL